jgi:Ca2+-dependent lipid-binding protein
LVASSNAEAVGYRNGLAVISATSLPTETVVWLNKAVEKLWRVAAKDADLAYQYPIFVKRAFKERSTWTHGGLEPYLSSAIGSGIVRGLEIAKALRPNDVAYISLHSLELGSRPPLLRNVRLSDESWQLDRLELYFEVDALLEDSAMVLEVKLSSLSYALLPSTQVKIHHVSFRAMIKAVLFVGPQHPFISRIYISMLEQPHCDFRVTPVSKDRYVGQDSDDLRKSN